MRIFIIEVDYLNKNNGNVLFTKVSQEGYTELKEAIKFIKGRTDYKHSINDFLHYGAKHNYTIREITVVGDINNGRA